MKRWTAMASGLALAAATLVVGNSASAEEAPPPAPDTGSDKSVVESDTGSYIVVMTADPLLATIDAAALNTPVADAQGEALADTHSDVLAEAGVDPDAKVQDYTNALNGFSAVLTYDEAVAVSANPHVAAVLPDELQQLDRAQSVTHGFGGGWDWDWGWGFGGSSRNKDDLGNFLGLTNRGEAWKSGLTGEDVVIGVIDTGIWPEHPSFSPAGYGPSPIAPLAAVDTNGDPSNPCNFGNSAHNPNDAAFTCNNKLLGARQMLNTYRALTGAEPDEFDSARDDDGHGTHTASTAGGNSGVMATIFGHKWGEISGIAPRARIIAYKGLGNLGGYTSDLTAAIDQAVADGVDVINYSVGGGAQLWSADTIAYFYAADAGVFVAASAGNDGPGASTIGGPADVPWLTTVGANTQKQFFEGTIKLDRGAWITGASVTRGISSKTPLIDAAAAGGELCLPNTLNPALVTGKIVLCKRGQNGRIDKSLSVFNAGGVGMILYNATDVDTLFTDNFFVPTVMLDYTQGLRVKSYISSRPNPKAQLSTGDKSTFRAAPSMANFSSRGPNPTAPDIIKPDITAPGVQIMAGNTPFPDPGGQPAGQLFQAIAGTSMSSPVVAGIFALLKQAHPDWTPAMAKSALMTTARTDVKDNDRVSQAGPFAMGSGMVDPGIVRAPGSAFNPGLVYDAGWNEYLGFLCDAAPDEAFTNPAATCAGLEAAGIPTDASDLNYPSIGIADLAGSQTITRTVTSVASSRVTYRASVKAPAGFSVSVSPDRFTIRPGETVTYQMTITNTSGSLDTWSTGSITWKGGGYDVRSPIAVQGSLLGVADSVSGTGTDGSASFAVNFGYTGPYSAAAHGLVAPTDTAATISQDPDQTPGTGDDGDGVDIYPVSLSGVALARWDVVLPGDDDLDMYLLDGSGEVVAQSTNGGTNESIEIVLPADGDYFLMVHGWSVSVPDLAYTLTSWQVSADPDADDASLVIDAAPTAATIATSGTINVSWSGLTADIHYLGLVSHRNGTGIIDVTVLDVQS